MTATRMAPGVWGGHVQPVCEDCGWQGASTASRANAEREYEAHTCDSEAVEARRAHVAEQRRLYGDGWWARCVRCGLTADELACGKQGTLV